MWLCSSDPSFFLFFLPHVGFLAEEVLFQKFCAEMSTRGQHLAIRGPLLKRIEDMYSVETGHGIEAIAVGHPPENELQQGIDHLTG